MTAIAPTTTVAPAKPAKAAPATAPKVKVTKAAPVAPKPERAPDLRIVRVLVANPKKVGSKAFTRFALYVDGMTVDEALKAGLLMIDIQWDARRKHIELLPPA